MPVYPFELSRLDERSFEHLANMLALTTLGAGHTTFGPGSDGGRDGLFQGSAPYPSDTERWTGSWYLQSKFHAPHLSKDPQKWLLDQIEQELKAFSKPRSRRKWPDNWIIVTNIDPSGTPQTGCFDKAKAIVRSFNPSLSEHFSIWGGNKVLSLLALNPEISRYYADCLTPGYVLQSLIDSISGDQAAARDVIRQLVCTEFEENQYTRLEQAGSEADSYPGIHKAFVDLPYRSIFPSIDDGDVSISGLAVRDLSRSSERDHRCTLMFEDDHWDTWERDPRRARVWFIKGGPGQGKSTISQYFCQIHRAAIITSDPTIRVHAKVRTLARSVKNTELARKIWPTFARVPIVIELKKYAFWHSQQKEFSKRTVLNYISSHLSSRIGSEVSTQILRHLLSNGRWIIVLDGLDEVPTDTKDTLAKEIAFMVNDVLIDIDSNALVICTSRPQGYSGQFKVLSPAQVNLSRLSASQALACAEPIIRFGRTAEQADFSLGVLSSALESTAVQEIMQSPLQSHIMAVLVRDGQEPPRRKWKLFTHFYNTIKRREANKNFPDQNMNALLQREDKLLKAVHNRLGFELHARAETSDGAKASLDRNTLRRILLEVVSDLQDIRQQETADILWNATTERLVLVSTPENGNEVSFDVRQFQEFFAAEFIANPHEDDKLYERLIVVAPDAHWREVMHFIGSAFVENERLRELALYTSILTKIDQGESRINSDLAHELAIGSRIGGRLLQEGVLESDKKLRHQFRTVLNPGLASTDSWEVLAQTRTFHTVEWLKEILLDHIKRTKGPDNIGAAALFCAIASTTDQTPNEFISEILAETAAYHGCLVRLIGRLYRPQGSPSVWVIEMLLRLLAQPKWLDLDKGSLSIIYSIFANHEETLLAACSSMGFEHELGETVKFLLQRDELFGLRETEGNLVNVSRFGSVEVLCGVPSALVSYPLGHAALGQVEKLGGLFEAIGMTYRFYRDPARPRLDMLLSSLRGDACSVDKLPFEVRSLLTSNFASKVDQDPQFLINRGTDEDYWHVTIKGESSDVDWPDFIKAMPSVSLSLLCDRFGWARKGRQDAVLEADVASLIFTSLSQMPNLLQRDMECWPILLRTGDALNIPFRALILSVASMPVTEDSVFYSDSLPRVSLPDEAELYTRFVAALILNVRHTDFGEEDSRFGLNDLANAVSEQIQSLGPSLDALISVAVDENMPRRERGAALVAASIRRGTRSIEEIIDLNLFSQLYTDQDAFWYLPGIALGLASGSNTSDNSALTALSACLNQSRKNYSARLALDPFLQAWREVGHAPVHFTTSSGLWPGSEHL